MFFHRILATTAPLPAGGSLGLSLRLNSSGSGSGITIAGLTATERFDADTTTSLPGFVMDTSILPDLRILAYTGNSSGQIVQSSLVSGMNFSSIPAGSLITSIEIRSSSYLSSSTWYLNSLAIRITYDPTAQAATAQGIASTSAMGSPIVTPDPVNTTAQGIASTLAFGTAVLDLFAQASSTASTSAMGAPTSTQDPPPPPPPTDWTALGKEDEKVYIYKVWSASGNYVGVWVDTKDDLQFTQQINTPGTTTTVRFARSANTTKEVRAPLITEAGDPITTEDGARLVSVYETPNVVGPDTDIELNYNVDVYVHYGEFSRLVTQLGEPITTQAGDYLMATSGAPLGVRIFSGYILDYIAHYGEQESSVTVTLASHGFELSNAVVLSGSNTTVTYSSQPLETTLKAVLDTNPGKMTYSSSSIGTTGVSRAMKFQLNTKKEAIDSIFDQTPDGWYWYGNVADNNIYMQPMSTGYDHRFLKGVHIKSLSVTRTMENLKNTVYFVGGEVTPGNPATTLYKKYEDSASITNWRVGLERITDRRYTVAASAQARAQKSLSRYGSPIFKSPLVISSAKYDIESIKLGQTVGFANFGNYLDALPPLQIVSLSYSPTSVSVELGQPLERQIDVLSQMEQDLQGEQYENLPIAPS